MRKLLMIFVAILLPWQAMAMTTLHVDTDAVSPTHPTYNSLAAAIAYLQGYNGGVLDEPFVIECSGVADDHNSGAGLYIEGIEATSTNTLTIKAAESDRFNGVYDANKYFFNDIQYLYAAMSWLTIDGIGISTLYLSSGHANRTIKNNLILNRNHNDQTIDGTINNDHVYNNVIHQHVDSGSLYQEGVLLSVDASNSNSIIANNIIIAARATNRYALRITSTDPPVDTLVIQNNYASTVANRSYEFAFTNSQSISNNAASNSKSVNAPGTIHDIALSTAVKDVANNVYSIPENSPLIGAGADLSATFTTDITGATRTTPWDIGAFKYDASASGWTKPLFGKFAAKVMGKPVADIKKIQGVE